MFTQNRIFDSMTHPEAMAYRQAQLVGIPAGVEAWRRSGFWAGTKAAAMEAAQPITHGAANAFGAERMYGGKNFGGHWLGFGFEKTGPLSEWSKTGKAPFAYKGHIFQDNAATNKFFGQKAGQKLAGKALTRGLPVVGAVASLAWTGSAAVRGYKTGGVGGAVKGAATEVGYFAAMHAVTRLAGPMYPILLAHGVATAAAFNKLQKNMAASPRHLPYNITGDMTAFSTGQAYSMRQRSMQAIQKSHLNARSALGNEANYMHVSSMRMM